MGLLALIQLGFGVLAVLGVLALVAATDPKAKGGARLWLVLGGACALLFVAYCFASLIG